VFDPLLRREGAGRAARRLGWLAASSAFHVALLAAIGSVPILVVQVPPEAAVEVKFVKGQPMAARPAAPPPPLRRPPPREGPRAEPRPAAPLVQPKALSEELPHAHPEELTPEADAGSEGEEGVVGGVPGGSLEPAPTPPPPAEPVPFDEATMTRPVFVSGPMPTYTRRALERNVEGRMLVECVVTVEGLVRRCRVVEGLPFMNEAVVEALEQRRYRPATRGGRPIEVRYPFKIHLRQQD